MKPNDSAHPVLIQRSKLTEYGSTLQSGLTKREILAAMAMQGLSSTIDINSYSPHDISVVAVQLADALIKELSKDA